MGKGRPLIGITPGYNYDKKMTYLYDGYSDALIKAGGVGVVIPVSDDKEVLEQIAETFDGFLIIGGPDIDAMHFGEENLTFNGEINPIRDSLELYIIRKAMALNKPILGICRGAQMLNVAFGGTLFQDIASQNNGINILKHSQTAPNWYPTHIVTVEEGSKLWNSCKSKVLRVNSFHHQAVKNIAPYFKVTAMSSDGIIEAIEHEKHKFAVGVQWHPELMWRENPEFLNLFIDFIHSCIV